MPLLCHHTVCRMPEGAGKGKWAKKEQLWMHSCKKLPLSWQGGCTFSWYPMWLSADMTHPRRRAAKLKHSLASPWAGAIPGVLYPHQPGFGRCQDGSHSKAQVSQVPFHDSRKPTSHATGSKQTAAGRLSSWATQARWALGVREMEAAIKA